MYSKFALEMIDHQIDDQFPVRLTAIIETLYSEIKAGKYKANNQLIVKAYRDRITDLIRDRFNLNFVMDELLGEWMPAAVIPFTGDYLTSYNAENYNASSIPSFSSLFGFGQFGRLKKIIEERESKYRALSNKKGYVDLKHARVGGYLAEARHYLIMNFMSLYRWEITPSEVTAIILHEIGHAFVGLETHYKLDRNNSAIMESIRAINQNNPEKLEYIYKRYFGEKELKKEGLSKDSKVTDFYGPLAAKYLESLQSQFGNGKYQETEFERQADAFASRFGCEKDLVTGLHKIHTHHAAVMEENKGTFIVLQFCEAAFFASVIMLLGVAGLVVGYLILIGLYSKASGTMTYDDPAERYNRIRHSIVSKLKDKRLPKEYRLELIEQHDYIESLFNNTNNLKTIGDIVADYVDPRSVHMDKYIKAQQAVENGLNNTLFVKSAQIELL